ncbi:ABC transporter substrate-binding protein, partial [candidate division NPL-UPA2 bacterium]|nr:ABC transporter substrate-binding protein [candidate division NPL-UPA2 bacterium]
GFNGFYHKSFMQRFKHQGLFANTDSYSEETNGDEFRLQDPDKQYKIIAFNPAVMVVDLELLGATQAPRKWEDILDPDFSDSVAVSGNDATYYCEGLLLNFYQSFGIEGVRKLGRSIKAARHPAEMVKLMGSKKINAPAVSIIPYFFTKMVKKKDSIVVVWPEDGAIVNPITMLVKKAALNKVHPIASFMTGELIGKIFAGAYLPSANSHVANKTPNGAKYKWLGWDFIRDHDLEPLVEELNVVSRETKSCHRGNPAKCF